MILSANSNICVSLGLVSIDCVFLLIRGIFYCFFACLIIFLWDARHCDFFHVVYCVVFVFLQIFLRFVNWDQSIAQSGANYYPLLTHSPFESFPQCPEADEALHSGKRWQRGNRRCPEPRVDARLRFL